jgi:hypothetical protein
MFEGPFKLPFRGNSPKTVTLLLFIASVAAAAVVVVVALFSR